MNDSQETIEEIEQYRIMFFNIAKMLDYNSKYCIEISGNYEAFRSEIHYTGNPNKVINVAKEARDIVAQRLVKFSMRGKEIAFELELGLMNELQGFINKMSGN